MTMTGIQVIIGAVSESLDTSSLDSNYSIFVGTQKRRRLDAPALGTLALDISILDKSDLFTMKQDEVLGGGFLGAFGSMTPLSCLRRDTCPGCTHLKEPVTSASLAVLDLSISSHQVTADTTYQYSGQSDKFAVGPTSTIVPLQQDDSSTPADFNSRTSTRTNHSNAPSVSDEATYAHDRPVSTAHHCVPSVSTTTPLNSPSAVSPARILSPLMPSIPCSASTSTVADLASISPHTPSLRPPPRPSLRLTLPSAPGPTPSVTQPRPALVMPKSVSIIY